MSNKSPFGSQIWVDFWNRELVWIFSGAQIQYLRVILPPNTAELPVFGCYRAEFTSAIHICEKCHPAIAASAASLVWIKINQTVILEAGTTSETVNNTATTNTNTTSLEEEHCGQVACWISTFWVSCTFCHKDGVVAVPVQCHMWHRVRGDGWVP